MDFQHPVLQEMLQLGCSNKVKVMTAFQAYMKLCEVDKLWDVQFFYNQELDLIYLSSADKVLHVPVPISQKMTPAWLHSLSSVLLTSHPHNTMNILLKTPDTSFLAYKMSEGLCPPPTPSATKDRKAVQEKVQYIQTELHKRKAELYEQAKRKRNEQVEEAKRKRNEQVEEAMSSETSNSDRNTGVVVKDELTDSSETVKTNT